MASTVTGADVLQTVIRKTGRKVGMFLPDARNTMATTDITDAADLANAFHSAGHYKNINTTVYFPGSTTAAFADAWRAARDLTPSTGLLDFDRDLSATTGITDAYLLFYGIMPQDFLNALTSASKLVHYPTREPVSIKPISTVVADAGFQSSATSSWTESDADGGAATTFSKITTSNSEDVFYGLGAGRILNAAANGYIRQRYNVTSGQSVVAYSLTRLADGTASELVLWDVTNGAQIGSTVEHSQESWQYMRVQVQIPATCKIAEIRHRGEGSSDDIRINGSWFLPQDTRRIVLDTMWDASEWALPRLFYVRMGGYSPASDVYDAHGAELVEVERSCYAIEPDPAGVHEIAIQIKDRSILQYPLYIQGRRALSDIFTPTLALTQTFPADYLDLMAYATMMEMFKDGGTASQVQDAPALYAMALAGYNGQRQQYRMPNPAEPARYVAFAGLP